MIINSMMEFIKNNNDLVISYLIIALFAMFFLLLALLVALSRINSRYKRLIRGAKADNIEGMILEYIAKVEKAGEENKEIINSMKSISYQLKGCIQRFGIVRYNAFHDTGSDLSFSLALLDGENNGVVISSIYGRSESITYAKPVTEGKSSYTLSKEEKEALDKAMR